MSIVKAHGGNQLVSKMRVVLCGGSGLIGRSLAPTLTAKGYEVCFLTRGPDQDGPDARRVHWDGRTVGPWASTLDGAHAVINLTGKSIDCVPTRRNRCAILESRVDSVRALQMAVAGLAVPPKVMVQCSAVGYYGDTGTPCDESAPAGTGFLAETCLAWEQAFDSADCRDARKVTLRLGVVLTRRGGALAKLYRLARLFMGGRVGSGEQWVSWVHMVDLGRMFLRALEEPRMVGLFNAVAPCAVTNATLMEALRRAANRPWSPPAPALAVRFGALLMGSNAEIALTGQRCEPRKLLEQGFDYRFAEVGQALHDLLHCSGPTAETHVEGDRHEG